MGSRVRAEAVVGGSGVYHNVALQAEFPGIFEPIPNPQWGSALPPDKPLGPWATPSVFEPLTGLTVTVAKAAVWTQR